MKETIEITPKPIVGLLDSNGNPLYAGINTIKLTIKGLGDGLCDIIMPHDKFEYYVYCEGQEPELLKVLLSYDNIIIESCLNFD